jgi:hypothetical protein
MLFTTAGILLLQASTPAASQTAPPDQPVQACATPLHAGFDFWVGEWDVVQAGQDAKIADSRIERKHGGCAVIESWMPLNGRGGTSLNHVDLSSGQWKQKWVGSGPHAVEFSGGPTADGMVLTGFWQDFNGPGRSATVRMTYTLNPDGSVRQFGEASLDHGVTWQSSFDLLYRPKPKADE